MTPYHPNPFPTLDPRAIRDCRYLIEGGGVGQARSRREVLAQVCRCRRVAPWYRRCTLAVWILLLNANTITSIPERSERAQRK